MIKIMMMPIAISLFMAACVHEPLEAPLDRGPQITDVAGQGGQLPIEIVQQASDQHGGSMVSRGAMQANAGDAAMSDSIMPVGKVTTLVLGPVNAERLEDAKGESNDAGQSIREVISQRMTASGRINLLDAPEERFIDDSPRPDLARKGIKYVVKGIASFNSASSEVTVFLRAVETMSGKVAIVASARNRSLDSAAAEASDRLLNKIIGAE